MAPFKKLFQKLRGSDPSAEEKKLRDDFSPGERTILASLTAAYPGVKVLPFPVPEARGPLQLEGAFVLRLETPEPHWLLVTRGFSELQEKETDDAEVSGYGIEMTCRLPARSKEYDFAWALDWLQAAANHVSNTGNWFAPGHHMKVAEPSGSDEICALLFSEDIALRPTRSHTGAFSYLQMFGATLAEYEAANAWSTSSLLALIQQRNPLLLTDAKRTNYLADPAFAQRVRDGQAREGSETAMWSGGAILWFHDDTRLSIHLDIPTLGQFQHGFLHRLAHDKEVRLIGDPRRRTAEDGTVGEARQTLLAMMPGSGGWSIDELPNGKKAATIQVSRQAAQELASALREQPGEYSVPSLPNVRFIVATEERMADFRYPW